MQEEVIITRPVYNEELKSWIITSTNDGFINHFAYPTEAQAAAKAEWWAASGSILLDANDPRAIRAIRILKGYAHEYEEKAQPAAVEATPAPITGSTIPGAAEFEQIALDHAATEADKAISLEDEKLLKEISRLSTTGQHEFMADPKALKRLVKAGLLKIVMGGYLTTDKFTAGFYPVNVRGKIVPAYAVRNFENKE